MNAIIMAGGEGRRLKDVTGDTPKPMALLAGRPVLEHVLRLLKENGVNNVCITLRYRPDIIKDYFRGGKALGMNIEYRTESEPLGTAGGVKACADFYGSRDFLAISGDCACDFDLRQLMEAHRRHAPAITMALYPCRVPLQYGTVLTDPKNKVVSFIEKPRWSRVVSDLVNTGIYIVSPEAMELVPEDTVFDFSKDLFPRLMEAGMEIRGLPLEGYWCDIGTPRAYHQCCLDALDGKLKLDLPVIAPELPPSAPDHLPQGSKRELKCHSRARLMRLISQHLMEAGADFSDGIELHNESGRVHISPSADREAVIISAKADTPRHSEELAEGFKKMLEAFSD